MFYTLETHVPSSWFCPCHPHQMLVRVLKRSGSPVRRKAYCPQCARQLAPTEEQLRDLEYRRFLGTLRVGKANSEDVRAAIGKASKTRWSDPEVKVRVSTSQRRRHADTEVKERHSEGLKRRWADPEFRAHQSAASKCTWGIPEIRERRIEAMREARRVKASLEV